MGGTRWQECDALDKSTRKGSQTPCIPVNPTVDPSGKDFHWYHAHGGLSSSGVRGIAGAFIILPALGKEVDAPYHANYTEEALVLVNDWAHESPSDHYWASRGGLHPPTAQSSNAHNVAIVPWTSALINGHGGIYGGEYSSVYITAGETMRLRLVNMGEIFAMRISVDDHKMTVISTDGVDTEPVVVDSVILHLGERYDVLITADISSTTRNYWIRANSLEGDSGAQVKFDHKVLGILQYRGAAYTDSYGVLPSTSATVNPVVLNCFDYDIGPSSNCLPVTVLQVHKSLRSTYDDLYLNEPDENHEVAFQHSRGGDGYGHYTRVSPNAYSRKGASVASHRSGSFTQNVKPGIPTLYYGNDGLHDHSLTLDVASGSKVQLIWNHESRTSHPIHLHGYKFVVAAIHEADTFSSCSITECPKETDWFDWPANKSKVQNTIGDGSYVVKDTVVLPAGGYLVLRFLADNPGHWLAHCHTDYHFADGMGLIIREGIGSDVSAYNYAPPGNFPPCNTSNQIAYDDALKGLKNKPACNCLENPETIMHASPNSDWKCSTSALCRHGIVDDQYKEARGIKTERDWDSTLAKAGITVTIFIFILCAVFIGPSKLQLNYDERKGAPSFKAVVKLIVVDEWEKRIKMNNLVLSSALALVGGLIYMDAGLLNSAVEFREKIALVFWMSAFWSVSSIYGAIVDYHSAEWAFLDHNMIYHKAVEEDDRVILDTSQDDDVVQSCSLISYHLLRFSIGAAFSAPFPMLFAFIIDTLTSITDDAGKVMLIGFILILTQQVFESLGRLLAEAAGMSNLSLAVGFASIFSQSLVIAGGFYRTVPKWLEFVSVLSAIRYSFSAIIKIQFTAANSYWCMVGQSMAWRGYTWCSYELAGAVQDLKFRGLNVIDSLENPTIDSDVIMLVVLIISFRIACLLVAYINSFAIELKFRDIKLCTLHCVFMFLPGNYYYQTDDVCEKMGYIVENLDIHDDVEMHDMKTLQLKKEVSPNKAPVPKANRGSTFRKLYSLAPLDVTDENTKEVAQLRAHEHRRRRRKSVEILQDSKPTFM
eukprot:CAMPEP_0185761668 /NCGR_PEP_ID=MMETSP1174-20130828/20613_1 /TAXON_ID=35687 /ORGANISM="Dictyocha speculum, Strain CCMP1381" /LENGTH=1048 /DNA_ID=CAMNT_0028443011 /DNA_START=249 /DNA_END=3395 /DNA_ORIENTATION=-